MRNTRTTAVSNQKGGVGKTTTTYHLASAAQRLGLKVLVIDTDPQGNLTSSLSRDVLDANTIGLADVLTNQSPATMEEVIVPALWDGVDLVPTTGEGLSLVRNELIVTNLGRETKLKRAIASLGEGRYDLILIDTPPSIDPLTINALVAADSVLIVTHAQLWSLDGLGHLVDNIAQLREHYNPELQIAGLVVNAYEKQKTSSQESRVELVEGSEMQGLTIFYPMIPRREVIGDTAQKGEQLESRRGTKELAELYETYIQKLIRKA